MVVRDIRNSLSNLDTVQELQKRIDGLPPDLEPYFMQMLNSVDSVYRQLSAIILLILLASRGQVPILLMHCFMEIENGYDVIAAPIRAESHVMFYQVRKTTPRTTDICSLTMMQIPNVTWFINLPRFGYPYPSIY